MAYGVNQAGIGLGIGVATLVTPLLLTPLGGWRGLTRLLGYVTLALAAFWLLTVRDRAVVASTNTGRGRVWEAMGQALAVKELRIVALCSFLFFGGNLGMLGYFPTYLVTIQGMSVQAAGGIATLAPWAFILGPFCCRCCRIALGGAKSSMSEASLLVDSWCLPMRIYLGFPSHWQRSPWGS